MCSLNTVLTRIYRASGENITDPLCIKKKYVGIHSTVSLYPEYVRTPLNGAKTQHKPNSHASRVYSPRRICCSSGRGLSTAM